MMQGDMEFYIMEQKRDSVYILTVTKNFTEWGGSHVSYSYLVNS